MVIFFVEEGIISDFWKMDDMDDVDDDDFGDLIYFLDSNRRVPISNILGGSDDSFSGVIEASFIVFSIASPVGSDIERISFSIFFPSNVSFEYIMKRG